MRGTEGFTLLELLAVLALLALAAAIAWPSPRLDTSGTALRRATSALVETLAGARAAAERDGRVHCVAVGVDASPGGCAVADLPAPVAASLAPDGAIRFHGDGSSSGAIVRLTVGAQARTVEVVGATGRIRER